MRGHVLLLLPALLSLAFAPAPLPKPPKKVPEQKFLGQWAQVGSPTVTLVITATTLAYHNAGGPINGYTLTFDAATVPRMYSIRMGAGAAFHGIYRVEGDTLTLCYRQAAQPRPISFTEMGAHTEVFKLLKR